MPIWQQFFWTKRAIRHKFLNKTAWEIHVLTRRGKHDSYSLYTIRQHHTKKEPYEIHLSKQKKPWVINFCTQSCIHDSHKKRGLRNLFLVKKGALSNKSRDSIMHAWLILIIHIWQYMSHTHYTHLQAVFFWKKEALRNKFLEKKPALRNEFSDSIMHTWLILIIYIWQHHTQKKRALRNPFLETKGALKNKIWTQTCKHGLHSLYTFDNRF